MQNFFKVPQVSSNLKQLMCVNLLCHAHPHQMERILQLWQHTVTTKHQEK